MKVFISYSTDDLALVRDIANYIRPHAEVFHWDKSKTPGENDCCGNNSGDAESSSQ